MIYQQFIDNTTKTFLLADGAGQSKLGPDNAFQKPGNPMMLSLDPKGAPYMDAYWYLKLGPQKPQVIMQEVNAKFPSKLDYDRSQAFEFETDLIMGGLHFDTGIQAEFDKGVWRTFDLPTKRWVDSKLALPSWQDWLNGVDVVAVCSVLKYTVVPKLVGVAGIRYEGLWVNGSWMTLGVFSKCEKVSGGDHFNSAVQLDGNKAGEPYRCEVAIADVRIL